MPRKILKVFSFILCFLLIFEQSGFAQVAAQIDISGAFSNLQKQIAIDRFRPLHLRYLSYNPLDNNFKLLLDKGNLPTPPKTQELKDSTKQLLNYFFVGLSLPNDSFWVNLRPDSPDNIIDKDLAKTDIGRILLEADVQLKKDTAKYTSPDTATGKAYWDKLYQKAAELFPNSTSLSIPTLTRPWIVPGEIILGESESNAYIYKATLKVMLEDDYLPNSKNYSFDDPRLKQLNEYSAQLIREQIIPKLTKEVNSSKRYAQLRQVYYSLIIAQWFKQRFSTKDTKYTNLIDARNLKDLTSKKGWSKNTYFNDYQKSFKQGEYNFRTPVNTPTGRKIRTYFSGGIGEMELFGSLYREAKANANLPLDQPVPPRQKIEAQASMGLNVGGNKEKESDNNKPTSVTIIGVAQSSSGENNAQEADLPPFNPNIHTPPVKYDGNKDEITIEENPIKDSAPGLTREKDRERNWRNSRGAALMPWVEQAADTLAAGIKKIAGRFTKKEKVQKIEQVNTPEEKKPELPIPQDDRVIDFEHYVWAAAKLAEGNLSPGVLNGLLSALKLNLNLTGTTVYRKIYEALVKQNYPQEAMKWLIGDTYKNPRIDNEISRQNKNPRAQSIFEAVANSLDAHGFSIGQFGKGVKQILDWLEPNGRDRVEVVTREDNSPAYRLVITKNAAGKLQISIHEISPEDFSAAAQNYSGSPISHGTVVRVETEKIIPAEEAKAKGASGESQEAIAEGIHKRFPFVSSVDIFTQTENETTPQIVNGFENKKVIVPAESAGQTSHEAQGRFVKVVFSQQSIVIADNALGMDAETISRMFVPREGTKQPPVLSGTTAQEETKKIKVVHDTGLPQRVSFSRNGEVVSAVDIPEDIQDGATVGGGMMIEFAGLMDVPESRDNIIIPSNLKPGEISNFQLAVETACRQIVNHKGLTDLEKARYINTTIVGLDGLINENPNYEHVVKIIRARIKEMLAPVVKRLREQGYIILPHEKQFAKLIIPQGKTALFLHEKLFDWQGATSLKECGAQVVPGVSLGGKKYLPLVVADFTPVSVENVSIFKRLWHLLTQQDRLPIIQTERFIAIPRQLGGRALELVEKKKTGISPDEEKELSSLLERINILTGEEVETHYELTPAKKNMNSELSTPPESTGRIDSDAINGFLVRPPLNLTPAQKPRQKTFDYKAILAEAEQQLPKFLKAPTTPFTAIARAYAAAEDEMAYELWQSKSNSLLTEFDKNDVLSAWHDLDFANACLKLKSQRGQALTLIEGAIAKSEEAENDNANWAVIICYAAELYAELGEIKKAEELLQTSTEEGSPYYQAHAQAVIDAAKITQSSYSFTDYAPMSSLLQEKLMDTWGGQEKSAILAIYAVREARAGFQKNADEIIQQAVAILKQSEAEDWRKKASEAPEVAIALAKLGRIEEALDLARGIGSSVDRIIALAGIAEAMIEAEKAVDYNATADKALQEFEANFANPTPDMQAKKALLLATQGKAVEADALMEQILANPILSPEENVGEGDTHRLPVNDTLATIVECLAEMGQTKRAKEVTGKIKDRNYQIRAEMAIIRALIEAGNIDEAKNSPDILGLPLNTTVETKICFLTTLAFLQAKTGQQELAQGNIQEALRIAKEFFPEGLALVAATQAEMGGDFDDIDAAMNIAREINDPNSEAEAMALLGIARVEAKRGNTVFAQNLIDLASRIIEQAASKPGNLLNNLETLVVLAKAQKALAEASAPAKEETAKNRQQEAEQKFKQAITIEEQINDEYFQAIARAGIAQALAEAGRKEEARQKFDQALSAAGKITDKLQRQTVFYKIAIALAEAGLIHTALAVADLITEDNSFKAIVLARIAQALAKAGRQQEAGQKIDQALSLTEKIAGSYPKVISLAVIAVALVEVGRQEEAERKFAETALIAEKIDDEFIKSMALVRIAQALAETGRREESWQKIDQALSSTEKITNEYDKSTVLYEITQALIKAGRRGQAPAVAEKISDDYCKAEARAGIAVALAKAGSIDQALHIAEEQITDKGFKAIALAEIASALTKASAPTEAGAPAQKEQPEEWLDARATAEKGLALIAPQKDLLTAKTKPQEVLLLALAGRAQEANQKADDFVNQAKIAVASAGKPIQGNVRFPDDFGNTSLRQAVELLVELGRLDEAKQLAEQIKSNEEKRIALSIIARAFFEAGKDQEARQTTLLGSSGVSILDCVYSYAAAIAGDIQRGNLKSARSNLVFVKDRIEISGASDEEKTALRLILAPLAAKVCNPEITEDSELFFGLTMKSGDMAPIATAYAAQWHYKHGDTDHDRSYLAAALKLAEELGADKIEAKLDAYVAIAKVQKEMGATSAPAKEEQSKKSSAAQATAEKGIAFLKSVKGKFTPSSLPQEALLLALAGEEQATNQAVQDFVNWAKKEAGFAGKIIEATEVGKTTAAYSEDYGSKELRQAVELLVELGRLDEAKDLAAMIKSSVEKNIAYAIITKALYEAGKDQEAKRTILAGSEGEGLTEFIYNFAAMIAGDIQSGDLTFAKYNLQEAKKDIEQSLASKEEKTALRLILAPLAVKICDPNIMEDNQLVHSFVPSEGDMKPIGLAYLAKWYYKDGKTTTSQNFLERALKITEVLGLDKLEAKLNAYIAIAKVQKEMEKAGVAQEGQKAQEKKAKAFDAALALVDKQHLAIALADTANVMLEIGRREEALELLGTAEKEARQDTKGEFKARLAYIARAWLKAGRREQAEKIVEELSADWKMSDVAIREIAITLAALGRDKEAITLYKDRELDTDLEIAGALIEQGEEIERILAQLPELNLLLHSIVASHNANDVADLSVFLAKAYAKKQDLNTAREYFNNAVLAIETWEKDNKIKLTKLAKIAQAQFECGLKEEAKATMDSVLIVNIDVGLRTHVANYFIKTGKYEAAQIILEKEKTLIDKIPDRGEKFRLLFNYTRACLLLEAAKEKALAKEAPEGREEAIKLWQEKILPMREEYIKQAQAGYDAVLERVPAEFRNRVERKIKQAIAELYRKQQAEVLKLFSAALEGKETDFNQAGLPFAVFKQRMDQVADALSTYLKTMVPLLEQEKPGTQAEFYENIFSGLFGLGLNPDASIENIDGLLEALSYGWSANTPEQIASAGDINKLIQGLRSASDRADIETITTIIAALGNFSSRDPANNVAIIRAQLAKILNAKPQARDKFLLELVRAIAGVTQNDIIAYFNDPSKVNLGNVRPFIVFLTNNVEQVRPGDYVVPQGNYVKMPGGGVEISQVIKLEQQRAKKDEEDIIMDIETLLEAISQGVLPERSEKMEEDLRRNATVQRESGAYTAEIAQNSKDATQGKKGELTVAFYITPEGDYVEEATDNGTGALKEVALLIPASTKEAGEQKDLAGFFGTGKYTIFEGVDRLEIITKNGERAFMFIFKVVKDDAGNPLAIKLMGIKKVNDASLKQGVTVRRIKAKGNTIPELDQMLSQRAWKTFAGLAQDDNFKIYFIDHEGNKKPLEVKKEVLSETEFTPAKKNSADHPMLRILSCQDMPLQVVDRAGLRVSEIKPEYLELIPESLRGFISQLGIVIQIPLPLIRNRSAFEHENIYLPQIQKYIAIEFYKAIAYKTLTQTSPQFVFAGFPMDWETNDDYWRSIDEHTDKNLISLAQKINEANYSGITAEELAPLLNEKGMLDKEKNFVKLILLLKVAVKQGSPDSITSLKLRRLAIQEQINKAKADEERAKLGSGYQVGKTPDAKDVPYFAQKLAQARSIVTGHDQMRNPEEYLIDPAKYSEKDKELMQLAQEIGRHFGIEQVLLLDSRVSFAGCFTAYQNKHTMFLSQSLVSYVAGRSTNTIVHELAHLLEQFMQEDTDGVWKNGFVAHTNSFTHDAIGTFAEAMKYVAAVSLANHSRTDAQATAASEKTEGFTALTKEGAVKKLGTVINNGGLVFNADASPAEIVKALKKNGVSLPENVDIERIIAVIQRYFKVIHSRAPNGTNDLQQYEITFRKDVQNYASIKNHVIYIDIDLLNLNTTPKDLLAFFSFILGHEGSHYKLTQNEKQAQEMDRQRFQALGSLHQQSILNVLKQLRAKKEYLMFLTEEPATPRLLVAKIAKEMTDEKAKQAEDAKIKEAIFLKGMTPLKQAKFSSYNVEGEKIIIDGQTATDNIAVFTAGKYWFYKYAFVRGAVTVTVNGKKMIVINNSLSKEEQDDAFRYEMMKLLSKKLTAMNMVISEKAYQEALTELVVQMWVGLKNKFPKRALDIKWLYTLLKGIPDIDVKLVNKGGGMRESFIVVDNKFIVDIPLGKDAAEESEVSVGINREARNFAEDRWLAPKIEAYPELDARKPENKDLIKKFNDDWIRYLTEEQNKELSAPEAKKEETKPAKPVELKPAAVPPETLKPGIRTDEEKPELNRGELNEALKRSGINSALRPDSRSRTDEDLGGVDFRVLPPTIQPGLPLLQGQSPAGRTVPVVVPMADLDKEWLELEKMIDAGITPSTERIKGYVTGCCGNKDMAKALSCISEVLRMEEEQVATTDNALKDLLVLVESGK